MMNHKCKSQRGRSPSNKTDAIRIIEFNNEITRCYATIIPDKSITTTFPIMEKIVLNGSTIYADEHKSYQRLNMLGYQHVTVYYRY
ncbi:hypothetical protein H312_01722 [Anncaliia algerae PRA339]|uniref:ISXO2-like transposase domain-containing protein n=1 Tax=Anncaliia algerae PRA339 TaxID=1288291 RepID=A0A059F1F3_9MICR|nr:hypothetical protein H312_01722 [Anncaliia algerae PRA339]